MLSWPWRHTQMHRNAHECTRMHTRMLMLCLCMIVFMCVHYSNIFNILQQCTVLLYCWYCNLCSWNSSYKLIPQQRRCIFLGIPPGLLIRNVSDNQASSLRLPPHNPLACHILLMQSFYIFTLKYLTHNKVLARQCVKDTRLKNRIVVWFSSDQR